MNCGNQQHLFQAAPTVRTGAMRTLFCLVLACTWATSVAGPSAWTLVDTPTMATLNGVAIADEHLVIAVGNDGAIVHFVDGDSGTLIDSGTTENLLDVFAVAADFAVAAGINVVLLWDGSSWQPLVEDTSGVAYSPVWASPERDRVIFGTLGQQFNFLCPHVIGAEQQPFCRTFGQEILTLCGEDGEITAVRHDGAIFRLNEQMQNIDTGFEPAHEPPSPLNLNAAWVMPGACGLGPFAQGGIFAIAGGNKVLLFDGEAWVDTGLVLPFDQQLLWLGGTGGNFVLAVGFEPLADGTFQGVVWIYDGNTWSQRMDLPAGTPGLTDIAVRLEPSDVLFANGFEAAAVSAAAARGGVPDSVGAGIVASAEEGESLSSDELAPKETVDLSLEKTLDEQVLTTSDVRLTFTLTVTNAGPDAATTVRLWDAYDARDGGDATIVAVDCDQADSVHHTEQLSQFQGATVVVDELPAGATFSCEMTVLTSMFNSFRNRASVSALRETELDSNDNLSVVQRP